MTLEEARDLTAQALILAVETHGCPNRFWCSDVERAFGPPAMLAGRIGRRYLKALQLAITTLRPAAGYKVAFNRHNDDPDQPMSFQITKDIPR